MLVFNRLATCSPYQIMELFFVIKSSLRYVNLLYLSLSLVLLFNTSYIESELHLLFQLEPLDSSPIPIIASDSHEDLKPILDVKKEVLTSGCILKDLLTRKKQPTFQTTIKEEVNKYPTKSIKQEVLEIDDINSETIIEPKYSSPNNKQKIIIIRPSISNVKTIRILNTELLKKEKVDQVDIFEPIITTNKKASGPQELDEPEIFNSTITQNKKSKAPQKAVKTYKSHKLCNTSLKEYLCSICNKPFGNIVSLNEHEQTHKSGKTFSCNLCSYNSSNERSLIKHSYVHRKGKQLFQCPGCRFNTPVLRQFKLHKAAHMANNTFKCDDCPYMCSDYENLTRHKLKHKNQMFQCDKCVFTSRRLYYLDMHKLIHLGSDKANKCDSCDYVGSHARYLRLHKKMNSH